MSEPAETNELATRTSRPTPRLCVLPGERVRLEPLDWDVHGEGLHAAVGGEANTELWTWMAAGPFREAPALKAMLLGGQASEGWRTMVIRARVSGEITGMATYMRIRQAHGSAEIGCVAFGPKLKRTPEARETLHLMAAHLFAELGYRRYEWKCNERNAASKRAAERFGYRFEGLFRNDMVTKGKSRNTAWYSILDTEWPALKSALVQWLAPGNFAADGAQIRTRESFR
jgi:RimJ/RimL family protein N-acetyltransferase